MAKTAKTAATDSARRDRGEEPQAPAKDRGAVNAANKDMKLPHEHDQGHGEGRDRNAPPENRELAEKARQDIEQGRRDTDCVGEHGEDSDCPPRPDVARRKP